MTISAASGLSDQALADLTASAAEFRDRAYAPYSGFKVGAAVLTTTGRVTGGCCIENLSYGMTICAERAALAAAVLAGATVDGPEQVVAVAVVGPDDEACPPCGACRQWLVELAPHCTVIYPGGTGRGQVRSDARHLLPDAFAS